MKTRFDVFDIVMDVPVDFFEKEAERLNSLDNYDELSSSDIVMEAARCSARIQEFIDSDTHSCLERGSGYDYGEIANLLISDKERMFIDCIPRRLQLFASHMGYEEELMEFDSCVALLRGCDEWAGYVEYFKDAKKFAYYGHKN